MQLSLDIYFGRTSREFSVRTTTPSAASWERLSALLKPSFQSADGRTLAWLMDPQEQRAGASWTPNISDWPNAASVCSLSSVLEPAESIPPKYFLSGKACAGIIRRAAKRGKELPLQLQHALQRVAASPRTSIATED